MTTDHGRCRDFAAEVEQIATALLSDRHLCGQGFLTLARLAGRQGDVRAVGSILAQAIESCPDDAAPLRELTTWLWQFAGPGDAATGLVELIQRDPADAAARFNLALAGLQLGRHEEAIAALRQALRLRPHYDAARSLLAALEAAR